jgi:hypothetical protein
MQIQGFQSLSVNTISTTTFTLSLLFRGSIPPRLLLYTDDYITNCNDIFFVVQFHEFHPFFANLWPHFLYTMYDSSYFMTLESYSFFKIYFLLLGDTLEMFTCCPSAFAAGVLWRSRGPPLLCPLEKTFLN